MVAGEVVSRSKILGYILKGFSGGFAVCCETENSGVILEFLD